MNVEAFVLIGGRSSRMGRDKALVKLDGEMLAQRAVNTISAAFPGIRISLVARDEDQFDQSQLPLEIPVIYDIYKDCGPYSGLHAALTNAQAEWIFVLACDLPFVSVELLNLLIGFISDDLDAVVPVQPDGQVQPLCAFYRVGNCLKLIEEMMIGSKDLPPLRVLFERINTKWIKSDEIKSVSNKDRLFFNLNSADDFNNLREAGASNPS